MRTKEEIIALLAMAGWTHRPSMRGGHTLGRYAFSHATNRDMHILILNDRSHAPWTAYGTVDTGPLPWRETELAALEDVLACVINNPDQDRL